MKLRFRYTASLNLKFNSSVHLEKDAVTKCLKSICFASRFDISVLVFINSIIVYFMGTEFFWKTVLFSCHYDGVWRALRCRPYTFVDHVKSDVPQILINREPLEHINFDIELLGNCDDIVHELCRRLGSPWDGICSAFPGKYPALTEVNKLPPITLKQHDNKYVIFWRYMFFLASLKISNNTNYFCFL